MTFARPAGTPIDILQITDFHLLAAADDRMLGINTEQSFTAVLDAVRKAPLRPDLFLMTGDLVQDASSETYARLRGHLLTLPAPCYCIPGNHDDPALMRESLMVERRIQCAPCVDLDNWRIIGLDSTVPRSPLGELGEEQLALLERLLMERPTAHTLVTLHHCPLAVDSLWLDTMKLQDADRLFELLARHRQVQTVVVGHVHQALDRTRDGIRYLASPSTCFQFKPASDDFALDSIPQGYRWLRLFADGTLETGVERLDSVPEGLDMSSVGY